MSTGDWIGIVTIAMSQVAAVVAVVWRLAGWMARIEMKVDEVIARRLDTISLRVDDHEARIRQVESK
jgi:hypothetical protein